MTTKPSPTSGLIILIGIALAIVLPLTTGASVAWGIAVVWIGATVGAQDEKRQLQAEVDRLKRQNARWN